MRLAEISDVASLQTLYAESRMHGKTVGDIDWPEIFSHDFLAGYISNRELYCFEEAESGLVAAARLAETDNIAVWPDEDQRFLYVGKLATADIVRRQRYVPRIVMPAAERLAIERGKIGLRLNCLADNPGLMRLYNNLGFNLLGIVSIYSTFAEKQITTAKFEKMLIQ